MQAHLHRLPALALALVLVSAVTGCRRPAPSAAETEAFRTAVHTYLKAQSMDLRVFAFKELKMHDTTAEARISLEHAEGMVGAKVTWTFWFARSGSTWTVTRHQR